MLEQEKVVVTGLGVISPIGHGHNDFQKALNSGYSNFKPLGSADYLQFQNEKASQIDDFSISNFYPKKINSDIGRTAHYALAGAQLALVDSKIDKQYLRYQKTGLYIGTTTNEGIARTKLLTELITKNKISQKLFKQFISSYLASILGKYLNLNGPALVIPTACAAGNYALIKAVQKIKNREVDIVLAGGAESLCLSSFLGFSRLRSLAKDKVRPFDLNRQGLMLGEGAAFLVLESILSAKKRRAKIYAEVAGWGISNDAYHMTTPEPEGQGALLAMQKALQTAGIKNENIDYINAHGTGTRTNDLAETKAIKKCFGEKAYAIPVSSIKSMLGHTLGAAAALEAVACCKVIEQNMVPPTINYETPDPECDLDYVPNHCRPKQVNTVLSNSFAFGGNNACIIFKRHVG